MSKDTMENDSLAAALERLTQPGGAEPVLYKKALETSARAGRARLLFQRPSMRYAAAAAALLVLVVPTLYLVSKHESGLARRTEPFGEATPPASAPPDWRMADADRKPVDADGAAWKTDRGEGLAYRHAYKHEDVDKSLKQVSASPAEADAARQVVRKAVLDLQAADVRTTYRKVMLQVSEAGSEFVQDSALAGGDPPTSATVTLRVAAARLSNVMNQLRDLGKVLTETANGEDVTDRMVDLAAQIRNEERIEKELLDLVETRKDSPLKDVLEVREQLAKVRGHIEQLRAQQALAQRSVAYATILVTIHAEPEKPKPPEPPPPRAGFGTRLHDAAATGLQSAGNTVLWFAEVATAGLPWWCAIGLVGVSGVAIRRRVQKAATREPAPAV